MGLAPYGKPRYRDAILRELIDLKDDGSFRLNLAYFDFAAGLRMTNRRFDEAVRQARHRAWPKGRSPTARCRPRYPSIQERHRGGHVIRICRDLHQRTGETRRTGQ